MASAGQQVGMKAPVSQLLLCALMLALPAATDARIKRSQSAKVEFKRENHCPSTGASKGPCKGYVIDHIKPLACGGADAPENMQWQTVADGKAKDKWERRGC
jgi:hypothetical protein